MLDEPFMTAEALALAALDDDAAAGAAFASIAAEYLRTAWNGEGPVSGAPEAERLAARLAAPPPAAGAALDEVLHRLGHEVVAGANRLAHPMCMGHQVSPPLPAAIWVEPVISALNQSLAVREMSPAGTVIERGLVRWLCDLARLGDRAGGSFTSGGTEANFTGLLAARAHLLPDAWRRGVGSEPPVIVCGEHAHYSVSRAAGQLGIGTDNVVTVPAREHRMDVHALGVALDRLDGERRGVLAVVAAAGSTATGSFDDLRAIGELCAARSAWLHVDAAHGGTALLSPRHRHLLDGIEHAGSIAWDPHKLMLLPIPCSAVLVRDEALLDAAFSQAAPYLFRGDGGERPLDQGVRSFACSRRFEALKLWVALQRYGTDGITALHDRLCRMARGLHARIASDARFEAMHEPQSNILCFRWLGHDGNSTEEQRDALNLRLRSSWNDSGDGWITTTVLDGRRVLRVTIMNPRTTEAELDALLAGLARHAAALPS
jgi:L-2,4-diaminobutyrate decarboxylase